MRGGQDLGRGILIGLRLPVRLTGHFPPFSHRTCGHCRREAETRDRAGGVEYLLAIAEARDHCPVVLPPSDTGCAAHIARCRGPLVGLAHVRGRICPAHIAIGVIAGCLLERGGLRRILCRRQHRHGMPRDRHCAACETCGKEGHAHEHKASDRRCLAIDRANPGITRQRHAAARDACRSRGCASHTDHMQDDVERTPGGKIEEPHGVALERAQARLRHQEQRKDHREHGEEDDSQHDVQNRHPSHRLLRNGIVSVARLHVRTGLREGVDRGRASTARHAVTRLHEGVDCRILPHHLGVARARAGKGRADDRHVLLELVGRQRIAELGVGLLAPERRIGLNHWAPLCIERLIGLPASDDVTVDRPVALTLEPLLRTCFGPRSNRGP